MSVMIDKKDEIILSELKKMPVILLKTLEKK